MKKQKNIFAMAGLSLILGCENAELYEHDNPNYEPCEERTVRYRGTPTIVPCPDVDESIETLTYKITNIQLVRGLLIDKKCYTLTAENRQLRFCQFIPVDYNLNLDDVVTLRYRIITEFNHLDRSNIFEINGEKIRR